MLVKRVLVLWFAIVLAACTEPEKTQKVRIAINSWPAFEFLYLASELGFYEQEGIDVEIVELSALADVQRVYIQGRVDGFGSTVIEAVRAAGITQKPLSIILVPDFSAGADVIVGNAAILSVSDLKGRKVGAEVGSLGIFVLHAALRKYGMSLDDVTIVNVEQLDTKNAMANDEVDAVVTYPPYSISLTKHSNNKQIFDTSEIREQVIDLIVMRSGVLDNQTQWIEKFHRVWQKTLDYAAANRQQAYEIMAKREGVSVAEFADALSGLQIVQRDKQKALLNSEQLKNNIADVCKVLSTTESIRFNCKNIGQLLEPVELP